MFQFLLNRSNDKEGVFVETEEYERGFAEHYNKFVKPYVDKFEEVRQNALKTKKRRCRIFRLLSILVILILNQISKYTDCDPIVLIFIFIAFVSIGITAINLPRNIYKNSIKLFLFPNIISFFGDFEYSPNSHSIPPHTLESNKFEVITDPFYENYVDELKDCGIIPIYSSETSEDKVSGEYKRVKIDFFQTVLCKNNSSNGSGLVFKGVIISISVHKSFSGRTIIKTASGMLIKEEPENLHIVNLEDPYFEKIFEVYSSDQIEARYLITTSFMERLLQLTEAYGSNKIECSFYDNRLVIMIPIKRNLFTPTSSIFKASNFIDDARILLKEMHLILQIIDILKLDQNIGM